MLDDSRWVPETKDGCTAVALPPRNYTLVHEDGKLHKKVTLRTAGCFVMACQTACQTACQMARRLLLPTALLLLR